MEPQYAATAGGHFQNVPIVGIGMGSLAPRGHTNCVYEPRPGREILSVEEAFVRKISVAEQSSGPQADFPL